MSKYALAKQCLAEAIAAGKQQNVTEDEMLEALIVLAAGEFAKCAGPKRAADALRYELSNIGGDIDTVFLRSR
jgi:hypothetical protein